MKYTLYMYIDTPDSELIERYNDKADEHNINVETNKYPDSGFDLFLPDETMFISYQSNFVNFCVKTSMVKHENGQDIPTGFYMYPRSSISKTKVRLANCMGIIDSGYRGCLGGYFDVVHTQTNETIQRFHRLVQICSPTLEPFNVVIVDNPDMLGVTSRGTGGFGSTGTN